MPKQKQIQTNFRTTPDLKQQLEAAADANGRTFNKEVNVRLVASLAAPEAADQTSVPGLLAVAAAMNTAGRYAGFASTFTADGAQKWWNDPYAFDQAVQAANRIFEALRPPGKISPPAILSGMAGSLDMGAMAAQFGVGAANGILSEIATEEPTSSIAVTRAPKLRRDLGEELVNRVRTFDQGRNS